MKKCLIEDRHAQQAETVENCCLCHKKVGKSFKERLKDKVALVPIEIKQKFLDALNDGKNIGQAKIIAGIDDTCVAGEIIMQNIGKYQFLQKEAR